MNKQLEKLLQDAEYYTPAKTVTLDAAGGSNDEVTLRYTGLDGRRYGVNRFLPGGTGLDHIKATASFNNGRDDKFEDVQLGALRSLFQARTLRGALPIDKGTELFITLKNTDTSSHEVNFQIVGYDDAHMQQKIDSYADNGATFPEPEFVYITETIPSGSGQQKFTVNLPSYPLRLYRMAANTNGNEDEIKLSIRQERTRIKPEVFINQLNDEFRDKDIILPRTLKPSTAFDLYVTNTGTSSHEVSFIAECYKINGG